MACSGWGIEPWNLRFEKSRFVLSAKLDKQAIPDNNYCGKPLGEKFNSDPKIIQAFEENLNKTMAVKQNMRFWYLLDLVEDKGWIDS